MNGKVEISWLNDEKNELLVEVSDYDTGSATTFAATDYEDAYEATLGWLGYPIFTALSVDRED